MVAPYPDLALDLSTLAKHVTSGTIWPQGDLQTFPPPHLVIGSSKPQRRATGVAWVTEHENVALGVGRDGSVAARMRVQNDRRGRGGVPDRVELGLFTTIENLYSAILYARRLASFAPQIESHRHLVGFRLELHGLTSKHLMCDVPSRVQEQRRASGESELEPDWPQLTETAFQNPIAIAGNFWRPISDEAMAQLLDEIAYAVAVYFAAEDRTSDLRIGHSIIRGYAELLQR